jgi:hypothetical protein
MGLPCSTRFLNPKSEIRNLKQYTMFQIQMFKTAAIVNVAKNGFVFDIWSFDI